MRTALTVCAAVLVLAAGAACGERPEPTGATVPQGTVTVQGAGDSPTILHAPPRRIAAVGETPDRILRALGAGRLLVGSRLDVLTGPQLIGELRRARPDLIVGSPEADAVDLDRASKATGAPIYMTSDGSIRQVLRGIDDLGLLTGTAARARAQVATIQSREAAVAKKLEGVAPISFFLDMGFFGTTGDRSLFGDIARVAAGRNVAGANPEAGPFDLGELARRQPAVYLATSDSGTTLQALRRNPKTKKLAAVRNGRFVIVPARFTEAGPDIGEAVAFVARALHPDAFR